MRAGQNTPLARCVAGSYAFDYNTDGLAHYGLVPDLLQDLANVGLPGAAFQSLFGSVESYLKVWEQCLAHAQPTTMVDYVRGGHRLATHGMDSA
jgi:hypothetical protein